jgi:long-subunit acyl-CoA synthetase (AMP-forming)
VRTSRGRRLALADRLVLRRIRARLGLDQATVMITAAAPISPEVLRFVHAVGVELCDLYEMSDDVGVTSVNPIGAVRFGTVRPPLPGVDVAVARDGEILVRCDAVFAGYHTWSRSAMQRGSRPTTRADSPVSRPGCHQGPSSRPGTFLPPAI